MRAGGARTTLPPGARARTVPRGGRSPPPVPGVAMPPPPRSVWFDCREPTHAHGGAWWFSPPDDESKTMTDCQHASKCDQDLSHGYWGWSDSQ